MTCWPPLVSSPAECLGWQSNGAINHTLKNLVIIIIWPVRPHEQFPWKTIRKKVLYEGSTRQSDRAGKTRMALLEMRTAPERPCSTKQWKWKKYHHLKQFFIIAILLLYTQITAVPCDIQILTAVLTAIPCDIQYMGVPFGCLITRT